VQQILVQLAKQTAQTSSQEQAIQEIRQISSQVATYPFGTLSQVLSYFARLVASGNSNVVQIVQQTIQEKASSISKNITQSLSNVAVQQASGRSKNVNLVIRNAAQTLADRASVPVEKVEAVIIQIALQFAQAQGRAITGQYIFQIANQIIQDPDKRNYAFDKGWSYCKFNAIICWWIFMDFIWRYGSVNLARSIA
jgi:hypothetical protein